RRGCVIRATRRPARECAMLTARVVRRKMLAPEPRCLPEREFMKAYVIQKGATSLDGLRRVELADPRPGPGQVRVRMRAASLNSRDQAIVVGAYFGGAVGRDTIPLSDGAGDVVETGAGVTRFKTGDRVTFTFFRGWSDGPPPGPLVALGNPADGVLCE